jgi:hypothetical protein
VTIHLKYKTLPTKKICHPNDIGLFVNKVIPDEEKVGLLQKLWQPPMTYKFPILEKFKERRLKFQHSWFSEFPWLAYSENEEGAFCKYCFLFSKHGAGVNCQELGALVKTKFTNWKKGKEVFRGHASTDYHTNCMLDFKNLKMATENKSKDIVNRLDSARRENILKNRESLKPIVEAIILCGRQELALRGHRDSGNIDTTAECSDKNEGNFRAILRYRSKGDEKLQTMLENSGKIKYLSPKIQNEIISSCNVIILNKLLEKINAAKCFSILADETCDISNVEQISLCIRYVEFQNEQHKIREDFLQFEPAAALTGESLAANILDSLQRYGLDLNLLRGQGYDGAANMAGIYNGVHKKIQNDYPLAIYVHCASHTLNLAVSRACEVQEIRNCLGVIEKCYVFFNTPKRQAVLNDVIEKSELQPQIKTLKRLCVTRWIARYDAVRDFMQLVDFVIESLDIISTWKDSCEANTLKWAILNTEFCVAMHVLASVFAYTSPLCKELQKQDMDLKELISLSMICLSELQLMRKNAEEEFNSIFNFVKAVAYDIGIDLKLPRICARQVKRNNAPSLCFSSDSVDLDLFTQIENHFRVNLYIPFIDFFISELKERFQKHELLFEGFQCLFKPTLDAECKKQLSRLVEFYAIDIQADSDDVFVELKLWRKEIEKRGDNGALKSAIRGLDACDGILYPSVNRLLTILCTLPVTTCTPERSFSTLKRIKTYLRNTTGQVSSLLFNLSYTTL